MHIEYLREFVQLAHRLNFTAAAHDLHMSQPALSNHIATLEKDLGVSLFERTPQGVSLSPYGKAWLKDAQACVTAIDDAAQAMNELKRHKPATVTVLTHLSHRYIADLFRALEIELKRANPLFELRMLDLLESEPDWNDLGVTYDICFFLRNHTMEIEGAVVEDIAEDPLVAIVPKASPLVQLESLSLSDLEGKTVYLPQALGNRSYFDTMRQIFAERGINVTFKGVLGATMEDVYDFDFTNGAFIDSLHATKSIATPLLDRYVIVPIADSQTRFHDSVAISATTKNEHVRLVVEGLRRLTLK